MPDSSLLVHKQGSCLHLTFNREAARNAFNNELLQRLTSSLADAATDAAVRCVVLAGAGGLAFSAGIDLVERRGLTVAQMGQQSKAVLDLVRSLAASPIPVIAAIDGWCLGAGLEIALACDFRLASANSRFGFPEMALGTYPGGGGAVMLPRVVGHAKALELLLSMEKLDAGQALRIGLLTAMVPQGELDSTVLRYAETVASWSPAAVRAVRFSLRNSIAMPLEAALEFDQSVRRPLDGTRDYQEGLKAFAEKRKPVFTGT
jgi:enoyl-CoA hydratase/carnithine racemase